jgi:class 3 adenylate cyclase/tetratricopeptide (TPR) repeat protein
VDESAAVRAFLPRAVLLGARPGPGPGHHEQVDGSLLFADVSGFTRLSERLARKGRAGSEEMVDAISTVFGPLIAEISAADGDVLKFGGDALLVLFRDEGHLRRAASAAVAVRRALRRVGSIRTAGGPIRLSMSQGLHTGRFVVVHAGTRGYRDVVVAGPDATLTFSLESDAAAGEVLLSPPAAAGLQGASGVVIRRRGDGRPVLARAPAPGPPVGPGGGSVLAAPAAALERYVPTTLRGRLAEVVAESEHRTVSVGFLPFRGCDGVLAEHGPDELVRRLDRLLDATAEQTAEHRVTVVCVDAGPDGGKLMLAGGAPDADEDDAGALLRCCLALVRAESGLDLRAGLNRGGTYAGLVGAPARFTWSTMGDTVNVAARLAGKAAPRQVVASTALLEAVVGTPVLDPLPPLALKGKREPVPAAVVRDLAVDVPAEGVGLHTGPLAGRGEELSTLTAALGAARDGRGGVVEVVGGPGVGKSRLLQELRGRLHGEEVLWLRCERHDRTRAHAGSRALLRAVLAVPGDATPQDAGAALLHWLGQHVDRLLPVAPLVAAAMDADVPATPEVEALAPEFRVPRLHDAVEELLAVASPGPAVMFVEDVGRLDEASRGVLRAALRAVAERPWLVVTARRPGEEGLADGVALPAARTIALQPLTVDDATDLVLAVVPGRLSRDDVRRLVERSGGNPLFLLELVRSWASGATDALPDSVEGILAARIDRLAPARRRQRRYSAVLGERVDRGLLVRALAGAEPGTAVHQAWVAGRDPRTWLGLRGFLVPDRDLVVRFEHQLVRRVAYDALPFARRRELHGRVAAALEHDGSQELALLAHHHSQAGDLPRCWRYARAAAEQARSRYAPGEAADLYATALRAGTAWGEVAPRELCTTAELLGDTAEVAGRYAQAAAAYATARRYADPAGLPRLLGRTGRLMERMGRYPLALGWYARGLAAARDLPAARARAYRVQMLVGRGAVRLRQGRFEDTVQECLAAVAAGDEVADRADLAHAAFLLDAALTDLGRTEEAMPWRERALPVFQELGDLVREADVLNNLGIDAYYEGRLDEALDWYERSRQARTRAGDVVGAATAGNNIAEVLSDQGRLAEAEEAFLESLAIWTRSAYPVGIALATSNLGRLRTRQGRAPEALPLLREAVEAFRALHADALATEAEARLAEALLADGQVEPAFALCEDLLGPRSGAPGVQQLAADIRTVRDRALRMLPRT